MYVVFLKFSMHVRYKFVRFCLYVSMYVRGMYEKFCITLGKSATETFAMLNTAYGDAYCMFQVA